MYVASIRLLFRLRWWRCKVHVRCEGKAKPVLLWHALRIQIVLLCFFSLFVCLFFFAFVFLIVYPYLLNCIVPVMSLKSPVKLTGQIIYLSTEDLFEKFKRKMKKNASVANLVFSHLHQKPLWSGRSASFLLWGLYCLVLYFFQIKLEIVLKDYSVLWRPVCLIVSPRPDVAHFDQANYPFIDAILLTYSRFVCRQWSIRLILRVT